MLSLEIHGAEEQEALGSAMAAACPPSCIIYLEGELGAGKTTLVRGFLRGLGYEGAVKSPTYTLLEPYELPQRRCFHFDLYRLADPGELEYLGVRDLLQGDAVLLVEWPDKGQGELPSPDLMVKIHYMEGGRRIELEPMSPRGGSLVNGLGFD